ncbi:hypothetical protein HMPREF7215_0976 [Pyramidobacter piscolens W5455]|uniref:Uncharacterized protein n=1 Tax=Pyramidobacter piscolens W5455 TaxID=352165 RepID=A0ABM9ZT61_9BACT|nr:hypothetical protein HMPREF7215_0976 [Pyramidobacter piscolens W5455]
MTICKKRSPRDTPKKNQRVKTNRERLRPKNGNAPCSSRKISAAPPKKRGSSFF